MNYSTFVLFLCSVSYTWATTEYTDYSIDVCPDGSAVVRCSDNPCNVTTCKAYPDAECRANYCGGCNADFYVDGKKIDCDVCPDGSNVVLCKDNPCDVTKCEAHPEAECKPNYCGGCNAEFYVEGKRVSCGLCPDGSQYFNCFANPCDVTKCNAYPDAECRDNYCGGCNADFYFNGTPLSCSCDYGVSTVSCYDNPCHLSKCETYPDAKCIANYCGGCNAEYYYNGRRVYCGMSDTGFIDFSEPVEFFYK